MYFYYALAAIGPHMSKYLFWKRHMTTIQMASGTRRRTSYAMLLIACPSPQVQFVLIFAHSFQLLFVECDYPDIFMWWIGAHAVLFWFLFWDFYKQAYIKRTNFFACTPAQTSLLNGMNQDSKAGGDHHANGTNGCVTNGHASNGIRLKDE